MWQALPGRASAARELRLGTGLLLAALPLATWWSKGWPAFSQAPARALAVVSVDVAALAVGVLLLIGLAGRRRRAHA